MTPDLSPDAQAALEAHVEACAAKGIDPLEARAEALAFVQGTRQILDAIPRRQPPPVPDALLPRPRSQTYAR